MTQKQIQSFSYTSNNILGEGSTGIVYLGVDNRTGKQVAIKAIDLKTVDNEVTKYLLENEIKALQLSNHPNVLRAIDVVRRPDYCYVVTEYLQGKNLKEIITARGRIPEAEALPIFKAIVEGYSNLQSNKIVHRDLKPENIMFTGAGVPMIIDFGYCEIGGFMKKPKMFYNVGSPAYMSHESLVSSQYTESSEVWSLGAILYEMLEGKSFMAGDSKTVTQSIMNMKRNGVPLPTNVSEFSRSLVRSCMMLKPTDRIRIKDLLAQLKAISSVPACSVIEPLHTIPNQAVTNLQVNGSPQVISKPLKPKGAFPRTDVQNQTFAFGAPNNNLVQSIHVNRMTSSLIKITPPNTNVLMANRNQELLAGNFMAKSPNFQSFIGPSTTKMIPAPTISSKIKTLTDLPHAQIVNIPQVQSPSLSLPQAILIPQPQIAPQPQVNVQLMGIRNIGNPQPLQVNQVNQVNHANVPIRMSLGNFIPNSPQGNQPNHVNNLNQFNVLNNIAAIQPNQALLINAARGSTIMGSPIQQPLPVSSPKLISPPVVISQGLVGSGHSLISSMPSINTFAPQPQNQFPPAQQRRSVLSIPVVVPPQPLPIGVIQRPMINQFRM